MPQSAAAASTFYREVSSAGTVWTIRDATGFPQPKGTDGQRAQPFWSSQQRAAHVVGTVPAYADFDVVEIKWGVFRDRWIPGLKRDGILVGLNWTGRRATGYDVDPEDVQKNVLAIGSPPKKAG